MKEYKVVYENIVSADTPLEAAKFVEELFRDVSDCPPQLYVQEENSKELFSIDLAEDDEDAVLLVDDYTPMIKEFKKVRKTKK